MTYNPSSNRGYVPGKIYDATSGLTKKEFEQAYLKAMPVEEGFIKDKGAANRAIIVFNATSSDQTVTLDRSPPLNPQYGDQRFNEKEVGGVALQHGRCTHFPVHAKCYIVSVGEYRIGRDGRRYFQTALGVRLNEIANSEITVLEGRKDGELEMKTQSNMEMEMYFVLDNEADRSVWVRIVQEATAYRLSEEAIEHLKRSRKVDLGAKIIEETEVKPGGKLFYKHPPQRYYVRSLDDFVIEKESLFVNMPPKRDYVENAYAVAEAGQTVVFFDDDTRNGGIVSAVYDSNELKFVTDDIVITGLGTQ